MIFWIIGGVLLLLLIIGIITIIACYNKLVQLKNTVKSAWSDIDVQLKKDTTLYLSLSMWSKVRRIMKRSLLENVIKARASAMGATSLSDKQRQKMYLEIH